MKLETPEDEIETVEFNDSDTETIDTNEASTSGQSTAIVSGTEVAQFNAAGEFLPLHEPKRFFSSEKNYSIFCFNPQKKIVCVRMHCSRVICHMSFAVLAVLRLRLSV